LNGGATKIFGYTTSWNDNYSKNLNIMKKTFINEKEVAGYMVKKIERLLN
jgi:hypothetical protein